MQGRILDGRYRLAHQLGKGGMGAVWTAEHLSLHSAVAVKLLDTEIAKNPDAVERFRREAQAAATLRSAHVVQVLDYGVDGDTPYLVMELLNGEDLGARLQRLGRLTPAALVEIVNQVARAVGRAHDAGIVHRDLKPENIFIVNEGDHELVKVLDFGIAKSVAPGFAPSATRTGVTMGTPYYMSPEQAEGKREVDQRTDLWALGVIASECLTGVRPFDGQTFGELLLNICARPAPVPSTLAPVPRYFDAWFSKATHRDPAQRFASVQELAFTLAEVAADRAPSGISSIPMRTAPMDEPPPVVAARTAAPLAPTLGNTSVTVDSEDPPRVPVRSAWLAPVLVLAGLLVFGGGGFWLWSSSSRAAAPAASASVAAENPAEVPAVPSKPSELSVAPSASPATMQPQPAQKGRRLAPQSTLPKATAVAAAPPTPKPSAKNTHPAAPAPKTLRCVSDPFTGALAPAKAGQSGTVACKQNPFTGAYQRL